MFNVNFINAFGSEYDDFLLKEKTTVRAIIGFCSAKPKEDFCSFENLNNMFQVLKKQREITLKRFEQNKKSRMEILATK